MVSDENLSKLILATNKVLVPCYLVVLKAEGGGAGRYRGRGRLEPARGAVYGDERNDGSSRVRDHVRHDAVARVWAGLTHVLFTNKQSYEPYFLVTGMKSSEDTRLS